MFCLSNHQARRLLLNRQGLTIDPRARLKDDDWLRLITMMGFIQVDSIQTLARAHDAILFSRNSTYRPDVLTRLIEKRADLFENWTHDASIIPAEFFPYWRLRFAREERHLAGRWKKWGRREFTQILAGILNRVREHGPTRARDLSDGVKRPSGGWWDWHPGKTALEYHWRTGALAIKQREGFQKIYDLTERVLDQRHLQPAHREATMIDWCCRAALQRLGVATHGEIAAFFDHVSPKEAAAWVARTGGLMRVAVTGHDGSMREAVAFDGLECDPALNAQVPGRLRLLSPFDPVLRDRNRAMRLFGFDYRIEIFVPEAKRRYGYYVFPVLEGLNLIGRIDVSHNKATDALIVKGLWLEPGIRLGRLRRQALQAELDRYRRYCGAGRIIHQDHWIK